MKIKDTIEHIYIHIPFCRSKCGYCSFFSLPAQTAELEQYLIYLTKEINWYTTQISVMAKTIYLGGGTPSILRADQISQIISRIPQIRDCEITMEANPKDIDQQSAKSWKKAGINRVSMGWQSMNPTELEFLGRRHSPNDNLIALQNLREAGMNNISLDLIYGLPGQRVSEVLTSLQKIINQNPSHISAYCLSLADDCPLAGFQSNLPADDNLSLMYHSIRRYLIQAGWQQYEISNFCQYGHESRHNLCYWQNKYYLACGPSAAGYLPGFRYKNPASLAQWQMNIDCGAHFAEKDIINRRTRQKEHVMLALRTTKGLSVCSYEQEYGRNFTVQYADLLARYATLGLMEEADGYVRLTDKAYFVSNEIFSEFM